MGLMSLFVLEHATSVSVQCHRACDADRNNAHREHVMPTTDRECVMSTEILVLLTRRWLTQEDGVAVFVILLTPLKSVLLVCNANQNPRSDKKMGLMSLSFRLIHSQACCRHTMPTEILDPKEDVFVISLTPLTSTLLVCY